MDKSAMNYAAELHKKILAVMENVSNIPKTGYNQRFNYKYVEESQAVEVLRESFIKHGLTISWEATGSHLTHESPKMKVYSVDLVATITDTDTGYSESRKWLGCGADSTDKWLYKAFTGGKKYWLLMQFLISTGDDPERADGESVKHSQPPKNESRKKTANYDFLRVMRGIKKELNEATGDDKDYYRILSETGPGFKKADEVLSKKHQEEVYRAMKAHLDDTIAKLNRGGE